MNVTDEDAVTAAYAQTAVDFGGLDILVSNAGIASSAPIEETTLALWNKNMDILSTGYFLVSREAFKCFRTQGVGGSVIFIASKMHTGLPCLTTSPTSMNGLAPGLAAR